MICGKQRKFNAVSVFRKRSCFRTNGLFHRHIKGARSLKTRLLLSRSSGKRDQLQSHIRHFRFIPARGIRAKAAAACKFTGIQQKNRPVLNLIFPAVFYFLLQSGSDFIGAEAAAGADPACHFRVSPKLPGQFSVVLFPLREAHPICLQKKILIMKDPPVSLFSFS